MPTVFMAHASTLLLILAVDCALLSLAALVLAVRAVRRASRRRGLSGEEFLRRELEEISRRLAALEKGVAQVVEALPRSVQGVGVVRYDAFAGAGGLSFSVALLDGRQNGVVMSVLNSRDGSRVYGKAIQGGTSSHNLSKEEQQALGLARATR